MIETALFWLSLTFLIIYGIISYRSWKGLGRITFPPSDALQNFSIIIAARNEETNLPPLLDSLALLDYPAEQFEIIIADDRSTDGTARLLEQFRHRLPNVHILTITENTTDMPNKKHALRSAIGRSRFDILAFTDADCVVPKEWLKELSKAFSPETGAAAGYSPVRTDDTRWFPSFLRFEELKNSIDAAAAAGVNEAFMCTGRNFAYRKKVYEEVGGFEAIKHSVSGDDDLFLQLVQRTTRWHIRYLTSAGSHVFTLPPATAGQFINQRIRHVSASRYYAPKIKLIFASFHLFLLSNIALFFFHPVAASIVLMLRINIDGVLMAKGKEIFGASTGVAEFFRNEMLLLLYPLVIGPLGLFARFDWKGGGRR